MVSTAHTVVGSAGAAPTLQDGGFRFPLGASVLKAQAPTQGRNPKH